MKNTKRLFKTIMHCKCMFVRLQLQKSTYPSNKQTVLIQLRFTKTNDAEECLVSPAVVAEVSGIQGGVVGVEAIGVESVGVESKYIGVVLLRF